MQGPPRAARRARALERPRAADVRARARPRRSAARGVRRADGRPAAGAAPSGSGATRARARAAAGDCARTRSACPSSTASSPTARCGWPPRRSRCCRRSASSTRARPAWWRCPPPPTRRCDVPGLGGELKPFQRAGRALPARAAPRLPRRRAGPRQDDRGARHARGRRRLSRDRRVPREPQAQLAARARALAARPQRPGARRHRCGARSRRRDITVVNYDIVAARLDALCACSPRALVLDESHYCKNAAAQAHPGRPATRRGACRATGLVLALTGTPVMNRPAELISQLRILGRLEDFGSGAAVRPALPRPGRTPCACTGTCARAASCVA